MHKLLAPSPSVEAAVWKVPGALRGCPPPYWAPASSTSCSAAAPCEGRGHHCQWACSHLEGDEPAWSGPASSQAGAHHCHPELTPGREQNQLNSVSPTPSVPTPLTPTQPLTKLHTLGENWNPLRSAAPSPQALTMLPSKVETPSHWGEAQLPQSSCSSPSGLDPTHDRVVTAFEPRRNWCWHLALCTQPRWFQPDLPSRWWLPVRGGRHGPRSLQIQLSP